MKVCNFLGKFFIFLSFSFISFFNLSASCIKVEDASFVFLSQDDNECDDKSGTGILTIHNGGGKNNFDVLIPGKNDGGYTIELVFDRAGQSSISDEQSLFAFYDSEDNPVSELILKGSSIFYKVNNIENEGIDLSNSTLNDPNIVNPHAIIVVHDNIKGQLILNIDGAELKIENVPSVNASDIKNVKIGKNYVGNIGEFRVYGTELAINERAGAVKLLSGITGAKISAIELIKDKNGVTRSAVDEVDFVKCKAGQAIIGDKCNNAVISGFTPPSNSIYSGDSDIQYDPLHNGQANAKELECEPGYKEGSPPPKYWFVLDGDVPSVHTEGSCDIKTYILGADGNDQLPENAKDPGSFTSVSLVGFNADNPKSIRCNTRHSAEGNLGVYLDSDDILRAQGSCVYSSSNSINCYEPSLIGSVPVSGGGLDYEGCSGKLVVSKDMLQSAITDGSFDFKSSDSYARGINGDTIYGFNEIFTGQVTDMSGLFKESVFNGDISGWDTGNVTNMHRMFESSVFNGDISTWDTGNVTSMSGMFKESVFNGDISGWDTGSVIAMSYMFYGAVFNGDISTWDTGNVTNMDGMFAGAFFNGDISGWDTGSVITMSYMFYGSIFNQPLSKWDTNSVIDMSWMFYYSAFNGDISNWKTGNVTNMEGVFSYNSAFNRNISNWDTGSVTNMRMMFYGASLFDQDISGWCVKSVTNKQDFKTLSGLQEGYSPPFNTLDNCD